MEGRNYTITIKADKLSSGGGSPIAGDKKESDTKKSGGILTKEGAKAFASTMVAYHTVKSFATQVVNHEISMVQLRTGSNELQARVSFINQMTQQGLGILEGTVTGLMVGSLPGMVVGLALSTMHSLVSYTQKVDELNTRRSLENESLHMNYIRAGASGSRRNEQF
jgi:tetrahydromethanopterin S-methyltransferase subunit G